MFPSWSWASVKREIDLLATAKIDDESEDELVTYLAGSLALWEMVDGDSGLRMIQQKSGIEAESATWKYGTNEMPDTTKACGVVMAWKNGCFKERLPDVLNEDATWQQYKNIVRSEWPSLGSLTDQALGLTAQGTTDQDLKFPPSYIEKAIQPGRLLVFIQSLRLRMVSPHHDTLQTVDGKVVAFFLHKGTDFEKVRTTYTQNPKVCFGDIAVSLGVDQRNILAADWQDEVWNDSAGNPLWLYVKCCLKVHLPVLETENGISRRVGLAETFLKRWVEAKPEFGTFILE